MAEESVSSESEQPKEEKPKKSKKKLIIIIAGALLVFSISGFFAYTMLLSKKGGAEGETSKKKEGKVLLVALDPFVLNLAEQGRFLKVTIHFELADASQQPLVENNIPQLKDAIIILLSSKSVESIASPEGKLQLKDEVLLRANQIIGKDVIKNLYFTEFVMQ